jgi:hypothetical protein
VNTVDLIWIVISFIIAVWILIKFAPRTGKKKISYDDIDVILVFPSKNPKENPKLAEKADKICLDYKKHIYTQQSVKGAHVFKSPWQHIHQPAGSVYGRDMLPLDFIRKYRYDILTSYFVHYGKKHKTLIIAATGETSDYLNLFRSECLGYEVFTLEDMKEKEV